MINTLKTINPYNVNNYKGSEIIKKVLLSFVLGLFLLFLLFPLYWTFATSFKTNLEIYRIPPQWFPLSPTTENYQRVLQTNAFVRYLANNFTVAVMVTLVSLFASVFAGYALSRYPGKVNKAISLGLLSTQMYPVIGIIIALYTIFRSYGILNTHQGLVLAITAHTIPFCTWLIKGFFDDVPKSIEESAKIDGAGRFTILFRVVMPLAKPGLLAIGLYTFMQSWDDFIFGITLILSDRLRTLSAGVALRFLGEVATDWGLVSTVAVMGVLPMIILIFFFQRYMVRGLTAGAVKG